MPKSKLKWSDVEDIAFKLIDEYPSTNPMTLSASEIQKSVAKLSDFGDDPKKANAQIISDIQNSWYEERMDMEDELGPFEEPPEAETLDEDDYRDDRVADALDPSVLEEEDDEDKDEFDDGFHEEEEESAH